MQQQLTLAIMQERDKLTSAAEDTTRLRIAQGEAGKLQTQIDQLSASSKAKLLQLLQLPGKLHVASYPTPETQPLSSFTQTGCMTCCDPCGTAL